MKPNNVYLLVLSGDLADAQKFVTRQYPGSDCITLPKRELREAGFVGQLKALRSVKGRCLVVFVRSYPELQEPQLTACTTFLHRCRCTVIADSSGYVRTISRWSSFAILPTILLSLMCDLATFALSWIILQILRVAARPIKLTRSASPHIDLAYLYPYPFDTTIAGGAASHVRGFLSGLALAGGTCEIFSGRALPAPTFPIELIPATGRFFLFREARILSYNLRFLVAVLKRLRTHLPAAIYQRHGRYVVAGTLISRFLGIPLILEYNSSELRMASYGDPIRFRNLLTLCEDVSLRHATTIVVVSNALQNELVASGVPKNKILVNPNAVDPEQFRPYCGGADLRRRLGFEDKHVVVGFVGTFSYWHGVAIITSAIESLLSTNDPLQKNLRFLLVGDGPLCDEARRALKPWTAQQILFTGTVPHDEVPAYLDATDILLSPHVSMPDGLPFFGSPTKLFEYMAMAKAIVASDLDQLSQLLQHAYSAWLVEPGNCSALAAAITVLAGDPHLRSRLGGNARAVVMAQHTWQMNAQRVLTRSSLTAIAPSLQQQIGASIS
jgi:glycosyltransferase involved in cell wall biosynthesis